MVEFEEDVVSKSDHLFVKKDPARIYRGLKDMLVEEFDIDRIEEGRMEFSVEKPKDTVRLFAFKEKSPHTAIRYRLSMRAKKPKHFYREERSQDILKARFKISAKIFTHYPGGEPISWLPKGESERHDKRQGIPGLRAEEKSAFQKSKFYEILVGIWYKKFYSKEIHTYKEEAHETVLRIHNLMRQKFGVEEAIGRTGASHYSPPWK